MNVQTVTIPTSGVARVELAGVGFRVVPGRPAGATSARPGSYPVVFQPDNGNRVPVGGGHSFFLDPKRGFDGAQLEGEAGDTWTVFAFASREESVLPSGQRGTVAVRVQAATAIATGSPTLATDGFKVRPGTKAHTVYASGTLATARLWARSAAGVWYNTLNDFDFGAEAVKSFLVYASADRIQFVNAAGTMNLEVDAEIEVE